MKLEDIKKRSELLQREADKLVNDLSLNELLSSLGTVKRVGSSARGLLLTEDIDFKVYTDQPNGRKVSALATTLLGNESPVARI
jgi:hypothetical protein